MRGSVVLLALLPLCGCFDFDSLGTLYVPPDAALTDAAPPEPDLTPPITADLAPLVDATPADLTRVETDASIAQCKDGIKDGDESDVDCGGSCAPCALGQHCAAAADCAGDRCDSGYCAAASGPPFWLAGPTLNVARWGLAVTSDPGGTLYAIGGYDGTTYSDAVESYASSQWEMETPLNQARQYAAAAVAGGMIYAMGGEAMNDLSSVELYDPAQFFWSAAAPLLTPRSFLAGASVDGLLFAVGGSMNGVASAEVDSAMPGVMFMSVKMLPNALCCAAAASGRDDRLYLSGGFDGINHLKSLLVYDPTLDNWSALADLDLARADHASATGADGRIYVIGGYGPNGNGTDVELANVTAYDLTTSTWQTVAPLMLARRYLGAALGPDGRVYAVGGESAGQPLASVEAYGPIVTVNNPSVTAGSPVLISGMNFAAGANASAYLDTATSPVIGATTTDGGGNLLPALTATVPQGTAFGPHTLIVVDDRSGYPVKAQIQVH